MIKKPTNFFYRADIDGLRGIAILLVIVFHYFPEICPNGYVGVDIFFVISGYLIGNILLSNIEDSKFSFREFYFRRIRRIFPALIILLSACIIAGWTILLPGQLKELGIEIFSGAGFFSNLFFWKTENYFNQNSIQKVLLPLWSLSVEEQFYLLLPLAFILCKYLRIRLLYIYIALFLISFGVNIGALTINPMESFYSPFSRIWEFLLGGFLISSLYSSKEVFVFKEFKRKTFFDVNIGGLSSFLGLLLIALALKVANRNLFPGWYALLPTIGSFLIIAGKFSFFNEKILSNYILRFIGLISYPLYLFHYPLLAFGLIYAGGDLASSTKVVLLLSSVALAFATYKFIEQPIREGSVKLNLSIMALILLAALALLGVCGLSLYRLNGVPERFPSYVADIMEFQEYNDAESEWGVKKCFLYIPEQKFNDFSKCRSPSKNIGDTKPILLVWGDSHAAHLIPGLVAKYSDKYTIIQRTATSCAPIVNDRADSGACNTLNHLILSEIDVLKPALIILSGRWKDGLQENLLNSFMLIKDRTKDYSSEVVVIGPPPRWRENLSDQLIRWGIKNQVSNFSGLPNRTFSGLSNYYPDSKYEKYISSLVSSIYGVRYISLVDILCNAEGCLTRVGDQVNDLITIDYDHFSINGSIYSVSKFNL